jgi:predicted lipoprotein with Yx(FWY)xxD motif
MNAGRRSARTAGAVLAAAALISACGGAIAGDPYANEAAAPPAAIPAPAVHGGPAEPAKPALEIAAARTAALGWVVTDGKGRLLYRFDKDRGNPSPKSVCAGACAQKWPPVLVHGTPAVKGVPSSIVGKVRRQDGTWQLTLHGWPVYRFTGDTSPGQWKGQGLGGTWHTIKRTGARNTVLPPAPAADAAAPTVSDGYGNTSDY